MARSSTNPRIAPALHTLLRVPAGGALPPALAAQHADVLAVRAQCRSFVAAVYAGRLTGATGERFTDVVNIGIGGSDLGPAMATAALAPYDAGLLRTHFVSNVDGTQFADLAPLLDPARTLVVICSKTFTTQETLANAKRARGWLAGRLGEAAVPRHFAAVSTNHAAMDAFGVGADARFAMWDWVGGRYSLWSAVGLALELAIGSAHFEAMLSGAQAMDAHFRSSRFADNLPVLLGLIAHWNRNLQGCASHAVLPYTQRLARLPAYLQQLEMESLGKRVTRAGRPVAGETGAVIWGEPGSNAQHSFFQLLHQGTAAASADFLLPLLGRGRCRGRRTVHRELPGADARADGGPRVAGTSPGPPGQPAAVVDCVRAARSGDARGADRALRAHRLRPVRPVGHQPLRPMGSRARQEDLQHAAAARFVGAASGTCGIGRLDCA